MKLSNNQVNQHLNLVAPVANKGYEAVLRHARLLHIKKITHDEETLGRFS